MSVVQRNDLEIEIGVLYSICAREVSLVALMWITVTEYTLENDHSSAMCVRKGSPRAMA
jgi:hypothetical protein